MLGKGLRLAAWAAYGLLVLAGFTFAAYSSFNLFVRSGVTSVPDLVGLAEGDVGRILADQGLGRRSGTNSYRYDESVSMGQVMKQSPAPGSLVKRGGTVDVTISLGPERLIVPDVRGMAQQSAQVALASAGMTVGRSGSIYVNGALPGSVVDQDPPPGSRVGRNAPVDLFLCLENAAAAYLMPDLTYRDMEGVRRFFERRGFRFGNVKFEPYEGIAEGVVLRQYPLPGHALRRGDVISLVVATNERMGA